MNQIMQLLGISRATYFNWKKENRPIISFLEKYFTNEELSEFIEFGTVEKLEVVNGNPSIEYKLFKDFLSWQIEDRKNLVLKDNLNMQIEDTNCCCQDMHKK